MFKLFVVSKEETKTLEVRAEDFFIIADKFNLNLEGACKLESNKIIPSLNQCLKLTRLYYQDLKRNENFNASDFLKTLRGVISLMFFALNSNSELSWQ